MNQRGRKAWWNLAWPTSWLSSRRPRSESFVQPSRRRSSEAAHDAVERRELDAAQTPPGGFTLNLSAEGVARVLLVIAAALVATSLAAALVGLLGGPFVRLLYVGADLNLPSFLVLVAHVGARLGATGDRSVCCKG